MMNRILTCTLALLAVASVLLTGCAKKNPTRASSGSSGDLQRTASERMSDTQRNIQALRNTVSRMPGETEPDDRRLIADALAQTASALSAIEGDRPNGAFRQQLRIMENGRAQLQRMAATVASEPTEDSAIRAAYNALMSLRDGRFAGNEHVAQAINNVSQQVSQLDSVRGPLHSLVVAQSFGAITQALDTMSNVLEGRMEQPAAARSQSRPAA